MENYNHNLSSQMISLLNLINNNILSLTDLLKDKCMQGDVDGKDRENVISEEDNATGITFSIQDQEEHRNH